MPNSVQIPDGARIIGADFFQRRTEDVAAELLGKLLLFHSPRLQKTVSGRIVETEAYLGLRDPACHSYHGKKTPRTDIFYELGGHIYVYLIYGMYNCLNFITMKEEPEAVLIRALEPMPDCQQLFELEKKTKPTELLNGPGKICRAFGIDRSLNRLTLTDSKMKVVDDKHQLPKSSIVTSSRIGVAYAGDAAHWPLRFLVKDSPFVSKKA